MNFLLDTGAAFSVLPFRLGPLDYQTKTVIGVDVKPQSRNFTKPLHCKVGNWQGTHRFLYIPGCPAPLLGMDLLCHLQTRVTWGELEANKFLCLVSEHLQSAVEKEESVPFLDEVSPQVWDVSSPGLSINVAPVKILLGQILPAPGKDNIS